jgi:hypothetical protein
MKISIIQHFNLAGMFLAVKYSIKTLLSTCSKKFKPLIKIGERVRITHFYENHYNTAF